MCTTVDQTVTQTNTSTTALTSSPKLSTRSKPPVKKEVRDHFETISTDIDWMTNDPSQSNIPIRKRGRNRKTVQNNLNKIDGRGEAFLKGDNEIVENESSNEKTSPAEGLESNSDFRNAHPKKHEVNRSELNQPIEYEVYIENDNDPKNVNAGNTNKDTAPPEKRRKSELLDDFVDHLTALPDPLVSGKLDENELLKLKEMDEKSDNFYEKGRKEVSLQTSRKPEIRRFRTRSNVSVLEAASQMKAKSNDVTSISPPKSKRKKGTKKSPTVQTTNQVSSEIKRLLSNPAKPLTELIASEEREKFTSSSGQKKVEVMSGVDGPAEASINVSKDTEETNLMSSGDAMKNADLDDDIQIKTRQTDGDTVDEQSSNYPSAPKKVKLRLEKIPQAFYMSSFPYIA